MTDPALGMRIVTCPHCDEELSVWAAPPPLDGLREEVHVFLDVWDAQIKALFARRHEVAQVPEEMGYIADAVSVLRAALRDEGETT